MLRLLHIVDMGWREERAHGQDEVKLCVSLTGSFAFQICENGESINEAMVSHDIMIPSQETQTPVMCLINVGIVAPQIKRDSIQSETTLEGIHLGVTTLTWSVVIRKYVANIHATEGQHQLQRQS